MRAVALVTVALAGFGARAADACRATISVGEMTMKTYPFSDPDPIPATSETRYPYFRYDRTFPEGMPAEWKTVTLENEAIRVVLLPEVGGKVWGATDKRTGRDFLFGNHVMKFRDIAMRGPWTAGGIEFNFGIIGHAPTSGTPVDWFARENPDGSASCFIASEEFITRTRWQVEVRLGKDADEFETRVTWYNASGLPAPYYHWMNAAYSVEHGAEFLYPGKTAIGHEGEIETRDWPFKAVNGKDWNVGLMDGNAWGGPKSYHVLPGHNGFYGIWWRELGFGSYHRAEPYEKYGRKIWLQTYSPYGLLWMRYKTDDDGQNAELQSGRCFNQPRWGTYKTPFKHQTFAPGSTETFVEHWGPIRDRKEVAADLAEDRTMPKPRPVDAPADFDWTSAYGEYVRGTQLLNERYDAEGRKHLEAAIAKDRFFAPAYAALAASELRRGNLKRVHELCEKALAVDAYDPLANYVDGYAFFIEGDAVTARERLGVASMQPQYRSPSLALIARGYLREGDAVSAAKAAEKALQANDLNFDALLALAVARRDEDAEVRRKSLEDLICRFPLAHQFRYELALAGGEKDFAQYVRNELPAETWLELGSWYEEAGCAEDARKLFALAETNQLARVHLGDFAGAKKLSVAGVFPFRRETLPALERAVGEDGHWKFRYLLAVLKAYLGYDAEADALLESCGDEPDEAVFYQYRATRREGAGRLADLKHAKGMADNWRLGRQLVHFYEAKGDWTNVLATTTEYLAKWPWVDPLRIEHGRALLRLGRYADCMAYLKTVELLPAEHRGTATDIWQEAQDALGLERTWPENLGKGAPYLEDIPMTVSDYAAKSEPVAVGAEPNALGVKAKASVSERGGALFYDVTVSSAETTVRDRALVFRFYAPCVKEPDFFHTHFPRTPVPIRAKTCDLPAAQGWGDPEAGSSKMVSAVPVVGATAKAASEGLGLGVAMTCPILCRLGYDGKRKALYAECDIALAPECNRANLRFVVFPFVAEDGFRGAWEAYMALHAEEFRVRVKKQGTWMASMAGYGVTVSNLPGRADFGIAFCRHGGDTAGDDACGVYSFRYTSSSTWTIGIPTNMPNDLASARIVAEQRAAKGDIMAQAWRDCQFHDANGEPACKFFNEHWLRGVSWNLNAEPDLPAAMTPFVAKGNSKAALDACYAGAFPQGIDGEYVDSAGGFGVCTLDYNRSHFAHMKDAPLCFDHTAGRVGILNAMSTRAYIRRLSDEMHARGRLMALNDAVGLYHFLSPYADVMTLERTSVDAKGNYRTTKEHKMLQFRLLVGKKPFCILQNADFTLLNAEYCERYMMRCLAYGFLPSYFSPLGAAVSKGRTFFHVPEFRERVRPLYLRFFPTIRAVAEAGWEPVSRTLVSTAPDAVTVEQFGVPNAAKGCYVTVHNPSDRPVEATLVPARGFHSAKGYADLVTGETLPVCAPFALPAYATRVLDIGAGIPSRVTE